MATHESELFKDKIEVSLDGRQVFYLFFGGAVIATLVFVLGVMVGRRVESRAIAEAGSPVTDPLAALDRLEGGDGLAFPAALRGDSDTPLGAMDETLAKRKAALPDPLPGTGGPVSPAAKKDEKHDDKAEAAKAKADAAKAKAKAKTDAEEAKTAAKAEAAKPIVQEEEPSSEGDDLSGDSGPRRFTLQVGSFQDKSEADAFFKQLQAAGLKPFMVEADVPDKGTYFRVRVGGYDSYDEAIAGKSDFEDQQHVIAYVTRLQ